MTLAIGIALGLLGLALLWATWPRRERTLPPNRRKRLVLTTVERGGNVYAEYVERMMP